MMVLHANAYSCRFHHHNSHHNHKNLDNPYHNSNRSITRLNWETWSTKTKMMVGCPTTTTTITSGIKVEELHDSNSTTINGEDNNIITMSYTTMVISFSTLLCIAGWAVGCVTLPTTRV